MLVKCKDFGVSGLCHVAGKGSRVIHDCSKRMHSKSTARAHQLIDLAKGSGTVDEMHGFLENC